MGTNSDSADHQRPLPKGSILFTNNLQNEILLCMNKWSMELPYGSYVEFFRKKDHGFALGEIWGKAIRSGCMFYRYTGDTVLKRILDETVNDLLTTQQSNGSFSCIEVENQPDGPSGDIWNRKYVLLGLEDYYEFVNSRRDVLKAMIDHADAILQQVGPDPKVKITECGWSQNNIESASILEPIVRLYKLTGFDRYMDFADYIVKVSGGVRGGNLFDEAYRGVPAYMMGNNYPKAYEMTSIFEGLAEYYRVNRDSYYKRCLDNYFNAVFNRELTIVGGGGSHGGKGPMSFAEGWDDSASEQTNPDVDNMMETCVGVTWMKFCGHMNRLEADARAADAIEQYIYNGLIGAMHPSGETFNYFTHLNGSKTAGQRFGWGKNISGKLITCCNLNGAMGIACIPYFAVMQDSEGPVFNLYNGAEINTETPDGNPLEIIVETLYPLDSVIKFRINPEKSERFAIKFRIPAWGDGASVTVNGGDSRNLEVGRYFSLYRKWEPGDSVCLTIPVECRVVEVPEGGKNPKGRFFKAVCSGPIVLSRDEKLDSNYNLPVTIKADAENRVRARKINIPGTRASFMIPTANGDSIIMTDFASVDCWNGGHLMTWLPQE